MPNWCTNLLHIYGESEDIKSFIEANMGLPACYPKTEYEEETVETEPRFCFNALVPTPQKVLDLGYDAREKLESIAAEKGESAIVGMIDGRNWNWENWGTKWDIYCENIRLENCGWQDGLTEFTLWFETAWSPPTYWLARIAPKFPKLRFKLHYEEHGCLMGIAGDIVCEGDFCEHTPYSEEQLKELYGFDDIDELCDSYDNGETVEAHQYLEDEDDDLIPF